MRGEPELKDSARFKQILGFIYAGNGTVPKSLQGPKEAARIYRSRIKEEIHVSRVSGETVINNRFSPDNQIANFIMGQEPDEFGYIFGEISGRHDDLWDARTSGRRPKTRSLMALAARCRWAGVMEIC